MKLLFLTHSAQLGGAEFSLANIARFYKENCLVGLFEEGPFREFLEQEQIPVQVLASRSIKVQRNSNILQALGSLGILIPLISKISQLADQYDLIYAGTQKALVAGSVASLITQRPLIYHLRDILTDDHFSKVNQRVAITLANTFAKKVIANSIATQDAFVAAGGQAEKVHVVYPGLPPENYQDIQLDQKQYKQHLGIREDCFLVGHFSRLSPWKGQHVLVEALQFCPEEVTVILVGDALFGEQDYVQQLHRTVEQLGLENRVHFLGFRSDIPQLMTTCNLVVHSSTAPEPFGKVIVEAMLCKRPIVAANDGGAREIVESGHTGWLCPPGNARQLAERITTCYQQPAEANRIAEEAQVFASQTFNLGNNHDQIAQILSQVITHSA